MSNQPARLYKYRSLGASSEYTAAIVKNREIWFARPSSFNDPFDCNLHVPYRLDRGELSERLLSRLLPEQDGSLSESVQRVLAHGRGEAVDPAELRQARRVTLRALALGLVRMAGARITASTAGGPVDVNEMVDQRRQARLKTVVDELDASIGILSLSALCDSILLWSHYAANHRGVCLEFDREKLGAAFPRLQRVRYGEMPELSAKFPAMVEKLWQLAPETPHRLIVAAANVLAEHPPGEALDKEYEEVMRSELRYLVDWFYTKSPVWSEEQEWRALAPRNGLVAFPPEALTGIIIGCAASEQTVEQVRSWCVGTGIAVHIAKRVEGRFALDVVPLD